MRWHRFKTAKEPAGGAKKRKRKEKEMGKGADGIKGFDGMSAEAMRAGKSKGFCDDEDDEGFARGAVVKRERLDEDGIRRQAETEIKTESTALVKEEGDESAVKSEPREIATDVQVPRMLQAVRTTQENVVDLTQDRGYGSSRSNFEESVPSDGVFWMLGLA